MPAISTEWRVAGIGHFGTRDDTLLLSNRLTSEERTWTLAGTNIIDAPATSLLEINAYVAATADFNHDGHTDAVYRSTNGEEAIILLNGTQKVSKAVLPSAGFQRELVGAADFNNDGFIDLLWYDFETGRLIMWQMDGQLSIRRVRYWPDKHT